MEKEHIVKPIIYELVWELKNKQIATNPQQESFLQKEILTKLGPFVGQSERMLIEIKQALVDPELSSSYKLPVLLYASLLCAKNDDGSHLLSFYYEFTSKALKDLKRNSKQKEGFWENLFQKIYQFGILLLAGNRTLLLSMEIFATRVNSQALAVVARQAKIGKLIRIYNCILCVPEKYITLKQILSLALIFSRWEQPDDDPFSPSFFASFQKRTQKKLINKLSKYPRAEFTQQILLNLIKIILCGEELLFSYFLQAKFLYQCSKKEAFVEKVQSALDGLRKARVLKEGKRLFNFVITLLLQAPEQTLGQLERQSILYIALKSLSGKFEDNEALFRILVTRFLSERNEVVSLIMFRLIREEALTYLTVHKLKLLLNVFNLSSWKKIVNEQTTQSLLIYRMERVIELLKALARRYSDQDLNVRCQSDKCGISIQDVREVKSMVFVVVFEAVGKITEPSSIDCCLFKLRLDKGDLYQVIVSFPESTDSLSLVPKKEPKQRTAIILIRQGNKELLREKKQYLRFGQGNFQSMVTVSLNGKDCRTLQISIDGAYYDFDLNRKSEIKGFEIGYLIGTIRSFYALNCQLQAIQFHKKWCERERKLHYVVEELGIDKYCYKLNRYQQPPILQFEDQGWSWFHSKTQIVVHQTFKHPKVLDSYLQLGGLQTILFVLERLSRCLQDFKGNEQKIVLILKQFFEMLKLTAYLDETHSFINNIIKCYKFINPFLFLLIKRNHFIRESHDSQLLLSIFELMLYFRKCKHSINFKPQAQMKMKRIEKKLVVSTLANFEIWSNCSTNLQQFILSLIDQFIRNAKEIEQLIRVDLHKQLLSSVVLFATSETQLPFSQTLQKGLTEVCLSLYSTILKYYGSTAEIKQLCLKKRTDQSFVERDLNLTIALLQSLSHRALRRSLSSSQISGFEAIIRYLKKCFIGSDILFITVGRLWEAILWVICSMASTEGHLQSKLICSLSEVILSYVSRETSQDHWIVLFINSYLYNRVSTFLNCFKVINHLADKYNFITPGKSVIFQSIIETLISKLIQDNPNNDSVADLASIVFAFTSKGFYRLSQQKAFLKFLLQLKQKFFSEGSSGKVWRSINKHLMMLLFKEAKITQINAPVVNFILLNLYDKDQKHPLATTNFHFSSQNIHRIKELAKSHKSIQSYLEDSDLLGAYALIDHCRGWLAVYFLLDEGLMTGGGDVPLPFTKDDLQGKECVGGIIAYYLSGYCGPLELYLLLNIILYRQLGNRITFLSTLAPVSIYQKALEYLMNNSSSLQEFSGGNHLLVLLLNETVNSLNRGYIIKAGSITKEIQKILGPPGSEAKKKKEINLIESLIRASKGVQLAFQDSKVDKEMAAFLQLILNKLHLMVQEQGEQMKIFMSLAQQIKKVKETLEKKLKLISSRFFEVSREQWLALELIQTVPEPRTEKLKRIETEKHEKYMEQLNQRYQRVLFQINERGIAGEREWKQLLQSNEHWFELQGSLDDLSSCFYELDEKQIGPFGFYKLNIRPVRTDLNKLPYPRRQEYKDLILQKQEEQRNKQLYEPDKLIISKETSTFFDSITEGTREQLIKSIVKETPQRQQFPTEKSKKSYWCEWITKRGAYAGKLTKKGNNIEFRFTGHQEMPNELVYQISTNRCHWREDLSEWQKEEVAHAIIPFNRSEIFTRRYILRHTAFELFSQKTHRSYFFNLFHKASLTSFLEEFKNEKDVDLVINRQEQFVKKGYTEQWIKGQLSNFEYLCLINRYSGRSTNDLAQYPVMPWVVTNFDGKQNYTELNKEYLKNQKNLRDLSIPAGKLNPQKFSKLKMRLIEIDPSDIQIRFLYGTMYSNPTILYNFFIRLEPFTSLHWEHQGRKIDHADRLFSGINEQFSTVLSSSSDNKQLTPEFYYWPEFLRNRNQIELGRKQKGEEVHSVMLPVWARSPEEFIFKMREVLESQQVSQKLHLWIDLVFGQKAPYEVAEEHDNLYHYQCYEHDIFASYSNDNEIKTAQIAISEFGQVPQTLFKKRHPERGVRRHIDIDQIISIFKPQKDLRPIRFEHNDAGIILWNDNQIIFKKAAIPGLYTNFEAARTYESQGACYLLSINLNRWISISNGLARVYEKRKVKWQHLLDSKCLQVLQDYVIYGCGSRIEIIKMVGDYFESVKSLFGHHSDIILIRTEPVLDLIVSIDKSGLVLVHELAQLRFFKAFQLGVQFSSADASKIKVCIHQMGYYIILDHEQTLYIYNFLGEQLLEQELEPRVAEYRNEEEIITDIQLMSHELPIVLASSSKGNIYSLNFLDIINFKEIYPFKSYSRMNQNLLAGIKKRPSNSIVQFSMVHSRATSNIIHQIIVLYSDGEVVCFSESNQMGKQLQSNERLKSMGFV